MSQKRIYKQYPQEFKEEAVALVTEQGYSVPEAAKSLARTTWTVMVSRTNRELIGHPR